MIDEVKNNVILKQILPSSTTKMTKDSSKNNYVCWSPTESAEGFSEGLVRRFTSPASPKIGLTFVLFIVEVVVSLFVCLLVIRILFRHMG